MDRSWFLDDGHRLAMRLARIFLKKYKSLFGSKTITEMYPLFEPGSDTPSFFEVNLQDRKGVSNGYIIVSLIETHPPIIEFSLDGKSRYQQLAQVIRGQDFKPVLFPPCFLFAEDLDGNYISHLDPLPVFPSKSERRRSFDYEQMKKDYAKHRKKEITGSVPDIRKTWKMLKKTSIRSSSSASDGAKSKGRTTDYLTAEELPVRDYQHMTLQHPEYLAKFHQVSTMTGANQLPWKTGCAACAWLSGIGYHNNTKTLDLLRGTHYKAVDSDSYIARVMVELSAFLNTIPSNGGQGGVHPQDIKKGYHFIETVLGFQIPYKIYTESGGVSALQVIYDALCFERAPSVMTIAGHAFLATEVLLDLSDNSNDHFVRGYIGHGESSLHAYYSYHYLTGAWSIGRIVPRHDIDTQITSICSPAVIEAGDPDKSTTLVIATRNEEEHIVLHYSEDGKAFHKEFEIAATGNTPACMAATRPGMDFYIAWKESAGSLRLAQVDTKNEELIILPAPDGVIQKPQVAPAIEILDQFLIYIWEHNIAFTDRQNLEKASYTWPTADGYDPACRDYLGSLGFSASLDTPCLTYLPSTNIMNDHLLYSYSTVRGSRKEWEMMNLKPVKDLSDGTMELNIYGDVYGNPYPGCRRILFASNFFVGANVHGILYGTDGPPICEYFLDSEDSYRWAKEYKYLPPGIGPRDVELGLFSSYEIGPCVFTIYLQDSKVRIRYHSIDSTQHRLNYDGYPDF